MTVHTLPWSLSFTTSLRFTKIDNEGFMNKRRILHKETCAESVEVGKANSLNFQGELEV